MPKFTLRNNRVKLKRIPVTVKVCSYKSYQKLLKEQVDTMASDDGSGSFGWFLAGLGIGALVGVLYAPRAGRETRDELVANALDARDKANQLYSQGVDQATQYVQQGKEVANQAVQDGKVAFNQAVQQTKSVADKAVQDSKEVIGQATSQSKEVANEYVDKGKEYYDKGRTQWTEYVEKGKGLVQNQTEAAQAAADAYTSKTKDA